MSEPSLSLQNARQVREGVLPHLPPPASPVSSLVELRLEAPAETYPEAVVTDPRREHGWKIALAWNAAENYWQTQLKLPQEPTLLRYHFVLADGSKIQERRQDEGVVAPLFGVWKEKEFQIAVYNPNSTPPKWVAGQVVYQIFPDRFAQGDPDSLSRGPATSYELPILVKKWDEEPEIPPKGRDFYGGDLRGVINKLDYLKDLGITCIYFTPIFDSPTNHRYDANDYLKVDSRLGTNEDLRELIEQARARGLTVMLDGVFNHCSRNSLYFQAARADRTSPYYRWFNFPKWPDEWEGWLKVRDMPEFVECPEVEEFFFGKNGVAHYWLGYGTVGWRTDVTPWITDEYWRRFRAAVRREFPEAYLIAEDWGDASHRLLGDTFDATMNYRFCYSVGGWAGGKISPAELDDRLETLRRDTPAPQFMAQLNLLGSHDVIRLINKLGGDKNRVKLATAFQLAYPGVPMLYYGDEMGLAANYAETHHFAEDSRRPFPWANPDQDLLSFFRQALQARQSSPALQFGEAETVYLDEQCYGLLRQHATDTVLVLFNNSDSPATLNLPLATFGATPPTAWRNLLDSSATFTVENDRLTVNLPPLQAAWLQSA